MTSAALAYSMPSTVTISSDILGTIAVEPGSLLTFPQGLLGFPECRSFVLLPSERSHVYWLQSADYSSLAFLLVDPFMFFEGYTLDLDATETHAASPDEVSVLAIVTLPGAPGELPTANLQGPVVINTRLSEGSQVVLAESSYGIRESFEL
ncbi:MAG: flagellar assembly protein FliW [Gemmatimonadota bacterium]